MYWAEKHLRNLKDYDKVEKYEHDVRRLTIERGLSARPVDEPVALGNFVALSLALAVLIGALAGVLPARSAARLEPLDALRAE